MNPAKNLAIIEKYEDFTNYIYNVLQADSWNLVKFINKENELWKIRMQLASRWLIFYQSY